MTIQLTCNECDGSKYIWVLENAHDDKKEKNICPKCNGSEKIFQMTEEEEDEYWQNYW